VGLKSHTLQLDRNKIPCLFEIYNLAKNIVPIITNFWYFRI